MALPLIAVDLNTMLSKKVKVPPTPMAHRAAPISISSSPRPHVCECSESYSRGLHSGFASGHLGFLQLSKSVKCNQNLKTAIPQLSRMGSLLCLLQIFR